jgi:hypothetical protein
MLWFNRKKIPHGETEAAHDSRVEVVVNQSAAKEVVEEAKAVNDRLNKLLVENGFTLKIFLAAGGQQKYPKRQENF